jgi:GTPase SAR1 family protein
MQDQYFRVTHAALFCCDLAFENSLDEMRYKIEQLARAKDEDPANIPIVISVNKCDKGLTGHALTMEQVRQIAAEYRINKIMETSALDGTNVKEVFRELVLLTTDPFRRHPEWIEKIENGEPITTITARKKKCNVM